MAVKDQTRPAWKKIKSDDPKRLSKLIEAGFELVDLKRVYAREVKEIEDEIRQIEALVIFDFDKADIKEINTRRGTARFVSKDVPVSDPDAGGWEATYAYIVETAIRDFIGNSRISLNPKHLAKHIANTGFWDILHKRLGEKACAARWEEKQKIPGVKQFQQAGIKFGDAE